MPIDVRSALCAHITGLVSALLMIGSAQGAESKACAYVIAASKDNGATLNYLRMDPNAGTEVRQGAALVSTTGKTDLGFETFWALIPAKGDQYITDPASRKPVKVPAFYVVSLLTGGTLRLTNSGEAVADFQPPYGPRYLDGARPFLFVPLPGSGYRMGTELRYADTGQTLTLGGSHGALPADKTKIATDVLLTPDPNIPRGFYQRRLMVFAQNCESSEDVFARWTKDTFPRALLAAWDLDVRNPQLETRAKEIEASFPLPYYALQRVDAAAGCPAGSVAVGFKCSGDRCDKRTLVCRSYFDANALGQLDTWKDRFPIADQGNNVPPKGFSLSTGAISQIVCGDDRQCVLQYVRGFLDNSSDNSCRWVRGPEIEYWDTLYRDRGWAERSVMADANYRPDNEAWCSGTEVMAGIGCADSFDPPPTETFGIDRPPYCTKLQIRCCADPKGRMAGRLFSPDRNGGGRANVWSALYGDSAPQQTVDGFSCPTGYVAAGIDCGDHPKECTNKSLGCKRIAGTDDSERRWSGLIHPSDARPATTEISASAVPPLPDEARATFVPGGIAITGMLCTTPACRQIAFQYVRPFSPISACRWAPVTNFGASAPGECTASEFLGGVRCKDGDCSKHVELQCCVDPTGRLAADDPTRVAGIAPPRNPQEPENEERKACEETCDSSAVAEALKGCGLVGGRECLGAATVVLACHAVCAIKDR